MRLLYRIYREGANRVDREVVDSSLAHKQLSDCWARPSGRGDDPGHDFVPVRGSIEMKPGVLGVVSRSEDAPDRDNDAPQNGPRFG